MVKDDAIIETKDEANAETKDAAKAKAKDVAKAETKDAAKEEPNDDGKETKCETEGKIREEETSAGGQSTSKDVDSRINSQIVESDTDYDTEDWETDSEMQGDYRDNSKTNSEAEREIAVLYATKIYQDIEEVSRGLTYLYVFCWYLHIISSSIWARDFQQVLFICWCFSLLFIFVEVLELTKFIRFKQVISLNSDGRGGYAPVARLCEETPFSTAQVKGAPVYSTVAKWTPLVPLVPPPDQPPDPPTPDWSEAPEVISIKHGPR